MSRSSSDHIELEIRVKEMADSLRKIAEGIRAWQRAAVWDIPMTHRTKDTETAFRASMDVLAQVFDHEAGRLTAAVAEIAGVELPAPVTTTEVVRTGYAAAPETIDVRDFGAEPEKTESPANLFDETDSPPKREKRK